MGEETTHFLWMTTSEKSVKMSDDSPDPMAKIEEILSQRSDLSTFLVHMTKDTGTVKSIDALKSILKSRKIWAKNPFGQALQKLKAAKLSLDSQNCVCFTETPLVHLRLLLGKIDGRSIQLQPYGIAIPKKVGRRVSVNPVWYVDMTPGAPEWLTVPWDELIDAAIANQSELPFEKNPIAKLTPFVEQMGTWPTKGTRKEFWWEREWRKRGNFTLPARFIVIAPEAEHADLRAYTDDLEDFPEDIPFIDPSWSLEQIIGGLAGFASADLGL